MTAVVAIVIAVLAGIPLVLAVDRRTDVATLLGLSFLYGAGLIYFVMLAMTCVGIPWSAATITGSVLGVAAIAGAWSIPRMALTPIAGDFIATGMDCLTGYTVITYGLYATNARVWQWDFWMIWGMKGATFFESRAIDWRFLQQWWNALNHPDYPLLLPLNYAYTALLGGAWNDRWLGFYSVAFGLALLLIVRGLAARELNPIAAATIAFAASAFALSGHVGMAEAPLIACGSAAVLFFRRGLLFDERDSFRHGAILLGLAANCKNEGIALAACVAIALVVTQRRKIVFLIPTAILIAPWTILKLVHGLSTDLWTGSFMGRVLARGSEIGTVATSLVHHFQDRLLWLCIIAGIAIALRRLGKPERFVLIVTALQLAIFIVVYLGTPADVNVHISTSWPRLPRQIGTPILFIELAALAGMIWPAAQAGHHRRGHAAAFQSGGHGRRTP